MEAREALIALNQIQGLGSVTIRRLLAAFDSPERIFRADPGILKEALGRFGAGELIGRIRSADPQAAASAEVMRANERGARIVTLLDEGYPAWLKTIPDPPPVLCLKGTLLKEDEAAVSVVGTRRATPYGLSVARRFGRALAEAGVTVVSGLAEGIDGAAHEGALEAEGRTLAVLGHGLRFLFPARHRPLSERVAASGALVSEFPMEAAPLRENFPRRNRVISGLGLAVVVVEAPLKSGALITAREALEQGREVFAVPGPVSSDASRGTHQLLREGAVLAEGVDDILRELAPGLAGRAAQWRGEQPAPDPPLSGLSDEEKGVYEAVPVGASSPAESIRGRAALSPGRLLSVLTGLELRGLVKQTPGRGYSRER